MEHCNIRIIIDFFSVIIKFHNIKFLGWGECKPMKGGNLSFLSGSSCWSLSKLVIFRPDNFNKNSYNIFHKIKCVSCIKEKYYFFIVIFDDD